MKKIIKMSVEEIVLQAGESSPDLIHAEDESFYYVLSGYGVMKVDAYGYGLEPQEAAFVPSGTGHAFHNTGGVELVLLRYAAHTRC